MTKPETTCPSCGHDHGGFPYCMDLPPPVETIRNVAMPGLALAMAASGMFMPPRRLRPMPPPKKRRNPKREAQAAQRKARAINRRAGK